MHVSSAAFNRIRKTEVEKETMTPKSLTLRLRCAAEALEWEIPGGSIGFPESGLWRSASVDARPGPGLAAVRDFRAAPRGPG